MTIARHTAPLVYFLVSSPGKSIIVYPTVSCDVVKLGLTLLSKGYADNFN